MLPWSRPHGLSHAPAKDDTSFGRSLGRGQLAWRRVQGPTTPAGAWERRADNGGTKEGGNKGLGCKACGSRNGSERGGRR